MYVVLIVSVNPPLELRRLAEVAKTFTLNWNKNVGESIVFREDLLFNKTRTLKNNFHEQ